MAEKDDKTADEKEPTFENVEFEGEPHPAPEGDGGADGDEGGADERIGEREGVSVEGERAGETPEQKQARRRAERQAKKDRIKAERDELRATKAKLAALERQVEELGGKVDTRIGGVEKKVVTGEITAIDNRLDVLRRVYGTNEQRRTEAMTSGDGAAFNAADKAMREAELEYGRLTEQRKTLVSAQPAGGERPDTKRQERVEERPDPKIERLANAFIADFPDYNPEGSDEYSLIVQALDSAVTAEGFDPKTQDYWDELRERVRDRIPEWAEDGSKPAARRQATNGRPRPRSTVQGSGREGGGEGGAKYVVSAARVQAMKEAGVWDDPKKRARQIEQFKKWDRENAQRGA